MKQIYIASPLRGDYERNIKNAVEYSRMASEAGVLPLAPHIIFSQWCNDTVPEQREKGLELGLSLLAHCEELWVMGSQISQGMQGEIQFAKEHDIPTYFVRHPNLPEYYPVSADHNRLLTVQDSMEGSTQENYEDRFVLLRYESLKPEHRTPLNQLWRCTHGPGCEAGHHFSDTVHLHHPVDHDNMAVSRSELLGIAKPETLERLAAIYPKLAENVTDLQSEQTEDFCR